jgi:hypothetical protein
MVVANIVGYYDTATLIYFIVQAPGPNIIKLIVSVI